MSDNKTKTDKLRFFLESKLVGVNILLVLVYSNEDVASKKFKKILFTKKQEINDRSL